MTLRWSLLWPLLVACDGEPSCDEAFDEYAVHLESKFESCGVPDFDAEIFRPEPCDDIGRVAAECNDDCLKYASCGALDGSDVAQGEQFNDCITRCPAF